MSERNAVLGVIETFATHVVGEPSAHPDLMNLSLTAAVGVRGDYDESTVLLRLQLRSGDKRKVSAA
ncbi:hypothetical protein [Paraburkholderia terrae]|uniref:hypothetical protein n=1 Tax=Paraburkholderia terrae TaxID=311230 RepID=UPI0033657C40